jgi:hypothetical protein
MSNVSFKFKLWKELMKLQPLHVLSTPRIVMFVQNLEVRKPNLHKLIEFLNSSNHSNLTLYLKFTLACVCIIRNTSLLMVGKLWVLWKTEWWNKRQNAVLQFCYARSASCYSPQRVQQMQLHLVFRFCNPLSAWVSRQKSSLSFSKVMPGLFHDLNLSKFPHTH